MLRNQTAYDPSVTFPLVPFLFLELIFSCLFAGLTVAGEIPQFNARAWQTENGLPHNSVYAVTQTRDGYVWVGTQHGIARFDGVRFTTFNAPELPASSVRVLHQTQDGTLWIAPERGGLIGMRDGKFFRSNYVTNTQVRVMYESRDGAFWIGTTNGVSRWKDGQCRVFTRENGLTGDTVLSICENKQGDLWFGTSGGLNRFRDKVEESYDLLSGLPPNAIRSLLCDERNDLWIGSVGGGIARLREGRFDYFGRTNGLPDTFISTMWKDSREQFWVGTMSGLCRLVGDNFVAESTPEGTSYETVYAFTEDREGHLWLGTKEGLTQLQIKPFRSFTKQDGLSHNNAMAVYEDRKLNLWTGTWGAGACSLSNGIFFSYNHTNSPLYDLILSIGETSDGSLWFGGEYDGGLFQLKEGGFRRYGRDDGLTGQAIRVLYEDREKNLWAGTSGGLFLLSNGKFLRFGKEDGLAGNVVRSICQDREGTLWIGCNEGLTQRRNGKFFSFTKSDGLSAKTILSVYEDHEGNLWIGTDGGGLNRFRDGKFTAYTTSHGLFNDSISEILEDERGYLWMSCFSGVFRVSKAELTAFDAGTIAAIRCVSFGKADGMSSAQCNGVSKPAAWKARDGRLWFPTTRGIVSVDPNSIRENNSPPIVAIEEMLFDKNLISNQPLMELPPGRGELEFHYTALSFRAPEKTRFKYKLEGFDSEWVDAGTRRVAYYSNIKPGNYSFRVMAWNSDGASAELKPDIRFILQPHFWQTRWFFAVVVLAAAGIVAATSRFFTWKKVRHQLLRLEEQHAVEKERARIARDIHDDLGARLTEISVLSDFVGAKTQTEELKPHVGRISKASREMVRNLDALVWAINPKNDSVDQLALYIGEYVEMFFGVTSLRYTLEMPDDLPRNPLSSEERHHLFLTVKEALNNVVKHSGASEVVVRLAVEQGALRISLVDNGKGFLSAETRSFGNGLSNMKKRIEEIGGKFEISSEVGRGTSVVLSLNLH